MSPNLKTTAQTIFLYHDTTTFGHFQEESWSEGTDLTSGLALLLLLSADPLLLGPLSATFLLWDEPTDPGKTETKTQGTFALYLAVIHSRSCPSGRSAPPPPSSCTRSEHRWGPAARSDPCSDVSSGCPAGGGTAALSWLSSCCVWLNLRVLTSKSTFSPSGIFGALGLQEAVASLPDHFTLIFSTSVWGPQKVVSLLHDSRVKSVPRLVAKPSIHTWINAHLCDKCLL